MLTFTLISNEDKIFEGSVDEINIITDNGPVTLLPGHQPYMAKIAKTVSFIPKESNSRQEENISSGFVYTNGSVCFAVVEK